MKILTQSLAVAVFVTLAGSAGWADLSDWGDRLREERIAATEESLVKYGELIGQAMACLEWEQDRHDDLIDRAAAWRKDGWLDGIFGARAAYRDELADMVQKEILANSLKPCEALPPNGYTSLLRMQETLIEGWIK